MFRKKELSPREQIDKSQKNISRIMKKRDKLDKKHAENPFVDCDYEDKRKSLNREIACEIEKKEAAKLELKHPTKQNNTVNTTVSISKTDNSKSLHIHGHYHSGGKKKK